MTQEKGSFSEALVSEPSRESGSEQVTAMPGSGEGTGTWTAVRPMAALRQGGRRREQLVAARGRGVQASLFQSLAALGSWPRATPVGAPPHGSSLEVRLRAPSSLNPGPRTVPAQQARRVVLAEPGRDLSPRCHSLAEAPGPRASVSFAVKGSLGRPQMCSVEALSVSRVHG